MKKYSFRILLSSILILIVGFVAPQFVSEKIDLNVEHADPPSEADIIRIKNEARIALDNPLEKFLFWPGKLVITKQYSLSTYEVNAYTFFGIRFATLQVKCFGECSSFRKQEPGELEIVYTGEEVTLNKDLYNTTEWETFRSNNYYTFKYKPEWIIRIAPKASHSPIIAEELSVHPKEFDRSGPFYFIAVHVITGMNFDEFIRDIKLGKRIDDPLTPLVLNGHKGYIQGGTYYVYHKDNMYQISFNPHDAYGLSDIEDMAALSSLEFID